MMFSHARQLGLHLTNNHLRAVEIDLSSKQVISHGVVNLPTSINEMKKRRILGELPVVFSAVLNQSQPQPIGARQAVLSIGDEEIFTKILTLPILSLAEARAAAPHELEADLPLKAENMYLDLEILGQNASANRMEVMVFAASKGYVDSLVSAAEAAGLTLFAVEVSSLSLGRLYRDQSDCFMTIDIGSTHCSLTIFSAGLVNVNTSVAFHNPVWSKIVQVANPTITREEAASNFKNVVDAIAEKALTALRYYGNRVRRQSTVQNIYLSGSGARVPHFDAILSEKINKTVTVGRTTLTSVDGCDASFLAAIGAALRNTND